MAILEVQINDSPVAVAGGADFDVLVLGIIGATNGMTASVQLNGSTRNSDEQLNWFYANLRSGDKVRAVLRENGAGTPPSRRRDYTERESNAPHQVSDKSSICSFDVRFGRQEARTSADMESTLYATATWRHNVNYLEFEVWCTAADDPNQNRYWHRVTIDYDVPVVIEVSF